jgi:uncharacterized protein with HEPN domain
MKEPEYLIGDILNSIEKIDQNLPSSFKIFEKDEILQVFFKHHLQIMGEASSKLPKDFVNEHSMIDWVRMIGMRNVLVHNYSNIDLDILWRTVQTDLPKLKKQLIELMTNLTRRDTETFER